MKITTVGRHFETLIVKLDGKVYEPIDDPLYKEIELRFEDKNQLKSSIEDHTKKLKSYRDDVKSK